jgi:hypothetical protein
LIALGLDALLCLLPTILRQVAPLALGGLLAATNVLLPLRAIAPAYASPPFLGDAALRPGEQPLSARFGDAAELVAYQIWPEKVKQGDGLGVALLWRTLGPTNRNYTLGVHLLDATQNKVGELNIYPGRGNYATTLWRPGSIFREVYWVPVRQPVTEPAMGQVKVALFLNDETQAHLPVADAQGHPLGDAVQFGRFKLAPSTPPEASAKSFRAPGRGLATLDGLVRLESASWQAGTMPLVPGSVLTVTLGWAALGNPAADYQVFVHLRDAGGPAAFGDGPPAGGTYPTGLWERGEQVSSQHVVTLPRDMRSGVYQLVVGMYNEGGRLPANDPAGNRLRDDEIILEEFAVLRQDWRNFIPLFVGSQKPDFSKPVGPGKPGF